MLPLEGQITNDKIFQSLMRGLMFLRVNARPCIVPLECNIDVTSLKVRSQMTRFHDSDYLYFSRV